MADQQYITIRPYQLEDDQKPEDVANALAIEGWELLTVDQGIMYFRRKKQHPIPISVGPTEHKEVPYV